MSVIKSVTSSNFMYRKSVRILTSLRFSTASDTSKSETDWQAVHKFRYIGQLASLNKLKTYQICATIVTIPAVFVMPEIFDPTVVTVLSATGLATLSLASLVFKNTVGFVYTSKKHPELVKFAFLDFWGRRKETEMKINDVVPFSELSEQTFDDYFTTLRFQNDHPNLKLFHKSGGISDHKEFMRVFGSD